MKKKVFYIVLIALVAFVAFNYNVFLAHYYNLSWNHHYSNSDFREALSYHKKAFITLEKSDFLYNMWNDYFRLSELYRALDTYEDSLELKEDREARENYEFVLSLLSENSEASSSPESDSWGEDEKSNGEEVSSDNIEDTLTPKSMDRSEIYKLSLDQDIGAFSSDDEENIEDYIDYLQKKISESEGDFGNGF